MFYLWVGVPVVTFPGGLPYCINPLVLDQVKLNYYHMYSWEYLLKLDIIPSSVYGLSPGYINSPIILLLGILSPFILSVVVSILHFHTALQIDKFVKVVVVVVVINNLARYPPLLLSPPIHFICRSTVTAVEILIS